MSREKLLSVVEWLTLDLPDPYYMTANSFGGNLEHKATISFWLFRSDFVYDDEGNATSSPTKIDTFVENHPIGHC